MPSIHVLRNAFSEFCEFGLAPNRWYLVLTGRVSAVWKIEYGGPKLRGTGKRESSSDYRKAARIITKTTFIMPLSS